MCFDDSVLKIVFMLQVLTEHDIFVFGNYYPEIIRLVVIGTCKCEKTVLNKFIHSACKDQKYLYFVAALNNNNYKTVTRIL